MLTDIVAKATFPVHEKYRRRGVMPFAGIYASIWQEAGNRDFTLEVRQQNVAAQGLYEGLGFVSEGVRPISMTNLKDNAVIMLRQAERI